MKKLKLSIREKSGALLVCAIADEVKSTKENEKIWINLIKLDKPFLNGVTYSINQNTSLLKLYNGVFTSFDEALKVFEEQAKILKEYSLNFQIKTTEHLKKVTNKDINNLIKL